MGVKLGVCWDNAYIAALAQLVEHIIRNDGVVGSIPTCGTILLLLRQVMNSHNLTYQTIFETSPIDENIEESAQALKNCQNVFENNSASQNQNSFNAINQQLQDMLDKINNTTPPADSNFTPSYYEAIDVTPPQNKTFSDNLENKLYELTKSMQEWQKHNENSMQTMLAKINNIEQNLALTNEDMRDLKTNQNYEFVNLNNNINKQMHDILCAFEQNINKAIIENSSNNNINAHPKNWEEALENLFKSEDNYGDLNYNPSHYSALDDAAMQRIIQRSEMYHNRFAS